MSDTRADPHGLALRSYHIVLRNNLKLKSEMFEKLGLLRLSVSDQVGPLRPLVPFAIQMNMSNVLEALIIQHNLLKY